ncbi:MAG: zinc ribbon domain-containing protein [Clostridiales bacterium]|jgi:hypothetical protein|nr:zinc ribbon domain-containing protein [Clostridiales bacterium]
MSLFCSNCGSIIPENTAFCQSCGTPAAQNENPQQQQNPNPPQSYGYPNYAPQAAPQAYAGTGYSVRNKPSKGLILGLAIAAVAIIVVIIITVSAGGGGYKGVVNKYYNSFTAGNLDKMLSCYPPTVREDVEEDMREDYEVSYFHMIKSVKHKITDEKSMNRSEIRDLEDWYDEYNLDISEGYRLEVDVTVKFDPSAMEDADFYPDEDEMEVSFEIFVIKIKGKWYVIDESMF